MSIDHFFARQYDSDKYNCAHFGREVWQYLTARDLGDEWIALFQPLASRRILPSTRRSITRIPKPVSPSIVLMQRPKGDPHMGIFYRGKVLHIQANGPEYFALPIATRGFTKVSFYQ